MASTRHSLRELFVHAFNIYQRMEERRNLSYVPGARSTKLPILKKLTEVPEDQLPQELVTLQNELANEPSKFKNIIDVLAYYSSVLLKNKTPAEATIAINAIKPEEAPLPPSVMSLFSSFIPIKDEIFEKEYLSFTKKVITNLTRMIPVSQNANMPFTEKAPVLKNQEKKSEISVSQQNIDNLSQQLEKVQHDLKVSSSQNAALQKSLHKKESDLSARKSKLKRLTDELTQTRHLLQEESRIKEELNSKSKIAQTLLLEFNSTIKELREKLNSQINDNLKFADRLSELDKYLLFDYKADEHIDENDVNELIYYILSDMTLNDRYEKVTKLLTVDINRNDSEACAMKTLKIEIDNFYARFSSMYKESLFEEQSLHKANSTAIEKTITTKPDESRKTILEQLASRAMGRIVDCNNLRLFSSEIKSSDYKKQGSTEKEIEAKNRFREKISLLESRQKTIAAFYEEILKRIENGEKNKMQPLAARIGKFARRNYDRLKILAIAKRNNQIKQVAEASERSTAALSFN